MSVFLWHTIQVLVHLLGLGLAVHAVMRSRTAQGSIAWAVSLLTFPWLFIPFYLILGRARFQGYVLARKKENRDLQHLSAMLKTQLETFGVNLPDEHSHHEALEYLAHAPFLGKNYVKLLRNGVPAFEAMFREILHAKVYILVQFFIIRDDELGRQFRQLLIDRAAAGVRVYFLYDPIGCFAMTADWFEELRRAGVAVASFTTTRGPQNRFQILFRNHRKLVLVDGERAFVGGLNIGDEYVGRSLKFRNWRDTALMLEGPSVQVLQLVFVEDWYHSARQIPGLSWTMKASPRGNRNVLVLPTGPADRLETCGLFFLHVIHNAKFRLWITSPYFVPDRAVVHALQLAALRGVDVRIMLPEKADILLVALSAYSYLEEAERAGIKLFRYQPGFMHQKVLLVDDDLVAVGTANLDNRSFRLNFEMTIVSVEPIFALEMESMLAFDFENCHEVSSAEFANRSFWFKFAVAIARLLAPIQ